MTSTALARPSLQMGALSDPAELGRLLAASGYFADARDAAQAVVKVLAGQELGFGPIASMTGVYIVKGRVTLSANLMAAAIKRHPRYDYRVVELTNEKAELRFFEDGEEVGISEFTLKDAERAGLASGENWRKYPRNMLLWRALSNGAKFYCPDAFSGAPIYTPDELGADVDPETGEIIDMAPAPPPPPAPAAAPSTAAEPGRGEPAPPTEPDSAPAVPPEDLEQLFDQYEVPPASRRMALLGFGKHEIAELTAEEAEAIRGQLASRYGS